MVIEILSFRIGRLRILSQSAQKKSGKITLGVPMALFRCVFVAVSMTAILGCASSSATAASPNCEGEIDGIRWEVFGFGPLIHVGWGKHNSIAFSLLDEEFHAAMWLPTKGEKTISARILIDNTVVAEKTKEDYSASPEWTKTHYKKIISAMMTGKRATIELTSENQSKRSRHIDLTSWRQVFDIATEIHRKKICLR